MQVFDMIVDERQRMADLLEDLTAEQLQQPSLCYAWSVHDVAAHLVTYLRFGQAKVYLGVIATCADFDRFNRRLTARAARRSPDEIIESLRDHARARTTVPRSGYDPVLTDLVVHDLDIRVPLGIPRPPVEERLWVAFKHLTGRPSPGFGIGDRLQGLRLVATDTGWTHGDGAPVQGRAETLLLGIGGRAAAFRDLDGDGVPLLRQRSLVAPVPGPLRRLAQPLRLIVSPQPRERRSRQAAPPTAPITVFTELS
jgi:uncharacterized protein (TIGR03083 family)